MNKYDSKHFDIEQIIRTYNLDKDGFSLMKAQHIIALMVGFTKWADLLNASESELELAKLLFDNQDIIDLEDWKTYVTNADRSSNIRFDPESKLEIFKRIFLNGDAKKIILNDRLEKRLYG